MSTGLPGNIAKDCHPKVRVLAEYWLSIHPAKGLPGRQHLDPCDVPSLLSNIFLIDIDAPALRFTWRLMGTALVKIFGRDHTGLPMEGAYRDGKRAHAYQAVCAIVATRQPRWRRAPASFATDREYLTMERVVFPLARDGEVVDMGLGLILAHLPNGEVV
jgi:hypothetical protein